jgi:hypothetical protein
MKEQKQSPERWSKCPMCGSTRLVYDKNGRFKACLQCFENPNGETKELNPLDDY